jgi:hypothetical protein
VRRGLVSPARAREDYGVAVRPGLAGMDEQETARLRARDRTEPRATDPR